LDFLKCFGDQFSVDKAAYKLADPEDFGWAYAQGDVPLKWCSAAELDLPPEVFFLRTVGVVQATVHVLAAKVLCNFGLRNVFKCHS